MNRKAQVSTLILLIMIMLVFYILFLPASEREKLLAENDTSTGTTTSGENVILLSSDIGTLQFVSSKELEHTLNSALLEKRTNANVLAAINPFGVRQGWIFSTTKQTTFTIENPEITENVQLSFQLTQHRGTLRIKLNTVTVFDSEINSDTPQILPLKKELLQKVNILEFEAYGTGFFSRQYAFKDVKVVGDIVDVNRQSTVQTFIISPEEKNNLDAGALSFYAVCTKTTVGILTTKLNDKVLSTTVPDCNSLNRMELTKIDLFEGKNTLEFAMPDGKARLDSLVVKSKLKPTKSYIDYFNINGTMSQRISSNNGRVRLRVNFVDDQKQKTADLNVNGILNTIDQSASLYEKDITSKTHDGNNYLALTPRTELNVVNLQVSVE